MRNREEIKNYLGVEATFGYVGKDIIESNERLIDAAERIEQDFAKELAEGTRGYGLHCDFVAMPDLLENPYDYPTLIEVANYDGVVVYKRIKATPRHLFVADQTYIIEVPIDEEYHLFIEGLDENGCTNTGEEFNIDNIKNFCIEVIDGDGEIVDEIDTDWLWVTLDTTIEELKERVPL
jgi:hypothetical protein